MSWTHVYPLNDHCTHELEGIGCICGPRIDWETSMVIHVSLDGREVRETGEWQEDDEDEDGEEAEPQKRVKR